MTKKLIVGVVFAALLTCNVGTGFAVAEESDELRFCGSGGVVEQSETINYARKEVSEYSIKSNVPDYAAMAGYTNCANVAGAIVIGYYDRFCENLVPNYKTYNQLGSVIKYKIASAEIEQVVATLYDLMGTDKEHAGTTYNGFQTGMKSYVQSKGYNYTTEDLGNFNFTKYKAAVESNVPVGLFLNTYSMLVDTDDNGSSETINSNYSTVGHVEIGCGYRVVTYYNASNQVIATRTYLKVASGLFSYGISYLCLDGKSTLSRASAITIS